MMRLIMPIILIGTSAAVFFVFANPIYSEIGLRKANLDSYDEALNNSKALENQRDTLTLKENAMDPNNLAKLTRLLPESVDNIRLILEIEQIALPYGMVLKDVKYDSNTATNNAVKGSASAASAPLAGSAQTGSLAIQNLHKDYGVWDLSFSTTGSYNNFLNFTRDLENNLRIVDVSSIQFSSSAGGLPGSGQSEFYKYDFKIKTYWLKD